MIVGPATYRNAPEAVAVPPSVRVTTTSAQPGTPAGDTKDMLLVDVTTTTVAAIPPTLTVAPAVKFTPVRVTAVPPATGPVLGVTVVISIVGRQVPEAHVWPATQSAFAEQLARHALGPHTNG